MTWRVDGRRVGVVLAFLPAAALAAGLLYASFCAFTNYKCGTSGDYIRYTNMIWNTAHGDWFAYAAGAASYLRVHLSFSLALLAPLFCVWDHPFLLSVVQWMMVVTGGALLVRAGRVQGLGWPMLGALAVFWFGYHFTQSTQLCEFHTTAAYLLLLPWIYLCLLRHRRWVWIPLVLLCGLREEAGIYAVPLLLLFAVRERWRPGYVYAALCLAYVGAAVWLLYPALNDGMGSALAVRKEILHGRASVPGDPVRLRLMALGWTLLPLAALWRTRWHAALVLLPLPLLASLLSQWPYQYGMRIHYAAGVMAALGVVLVDALARGRPSGAAWGRPLALLLITAVSFHVRGFLPGCRVDQGIVYRQVGLEGRHVLQLARTVLPKEGVLTAEREVLSLMANRKDALYFDLKVPSKAAIMPDFALCRANRLPAEYVELVREGAWGVRYLDALFVLLERGGDAGRNGALLERVGEARMALAYTRRQHGGEVMEPGYGFVRWWDGEPPGARRPVSLGGEFDVEPGPCAVKVVYRAEPGGGRAGEFILNDTQADRHVLTVPMAPAADGTWTTQRLDHAVAGATRLELQVMGATRPLWLRHAVVEGTGVRVGRRVRGAGEGEEE